MDTSQIKQIVSLNISGLSPSQYTWNATQINSTSYRLNIFTSVSLNELSLSLNFLNPGMVLDSLGTIMEETVITAPLPSYDLISEDTLNQTKSISSFSGILSYFALFILLVLLFKGSYPLLLVFEVFQTVYFHYFIIAELPYNFS